MNQDIYTVKGGKARRATDEDLTRIAAFMNDDPGDPGNPTCEYCGKRKRGAHICDDCYTVGTRVTHFRSSVWGCLIFALLWMIACALVEIFASQIADFIIQWAILSI